ncbi:major facilitator superfamily, partial [Heterobasidion irregulare TC 32-1]
MLDDAPLPPPVPRWRAWTLLLVFSMAQMLDIFNVTAPTVALPRIASDLDVLFTERQWAINAYSLTFGAFLLTGGRFSAIYGPKTLFVTGFTVVGVFSIVDGFSVDGPMLFVFRAIQGIGAALTIPSALTMITTLFPERGEQDRALGIFAGFGAMGNVSGLVIGGVIAELLTWRWIFWIMAMLILPLAFAAFLLAPPSSAAARGHASLRSMDWLGLGTITLALILLVYAITEGNNRGWATGGILAPLLVAVALLPAFALIETRVKEPLVPPLLEYLAMNVVIFQESLVFQQVWHTSALSAALRIIPFGITGFITTVSMGYVTPHVAPRWILCAGELLMMAGALLLAYAPTPDLYWSRVLPGIILTALGVSSGFVAANIEMLRTPLNRPASAARLRDSTALIGAIFNADLQIGSALGLAIATAITARVNGAPSAAATTTTSSSAAAANANGGAPLGSADFAGYRAAYWFLVGLTAAEAVVAGVFLRGRRRREGLIGEGGASGEG